MLKAAELALFDAGNRNIMLMTADEGATPDRRGAAANKLLAQGAEIIVGPLFGPSVVGGGAHRARPRRAGAGLLDRAQRWRAMASISCPSCRRAKCSRVVNYAASPGPSQFRGHGAADAYGDVVADAFTDAVKRRERAPVWISSISRPTPAR